MEDCHDTFRFCQGDYDTDNWSLNNLQAQKRSHVCAVRRRACLRVILAEQNEEDSVKL
eukprot:TCALIF_09444-PA protein Name:"Protein of unknown function" AED:0.00 eAED:0.00 QI:23/1/0.5/1/1/1/2/13/57